MLDLSAFDAVLKEDYRDVVVDLLNKKTKILDLFTKDTDAPRDSEGRRVTYVIRVSRNVGVGAVGESKNLPAAGNQGTANVQVGFKYNYGRIQLTAQTIKASKTSKGSFKRAMKMEMDGMVLDLARDRNRQLWGNGIGILAKVNGTQAAGTTINVKDPGGVAGTVGGARLIVPNQTIAFVRSATPASATDSDIVATATTRKVSSLGSDLSSITLALTTGAQLNDGDLIVSAPAGTTVTDESSINKEVMGMLGLVDDGTYLDTVGNISRATYDQYKAVVLAVNGAFALDYLQRAWDAADEKSGMGVSKIISHHSVRREYLKLLMALRRYVGDGPSSADAGFNGGAIEKDIKWAGVPWTVERMCPYGQIYGINTDYNIRFVNSEGEWADDDGTILMRVSGQDSYEGRFRVFDNFHNDRPDCSFRLDNVTATVDVQRAE